ncbi:Membrane protein (fragment), partial [Pseudomonas inefficax]
MPPAHTHSVALPSPVSAWRQQMHDNPWIGAGLALSMLVVLVLLGASLWNAVNGDHADNLHLAALGGLSGFGATALGAVLAVVLRDVRART